MPVSGAAIGAAGVGLVLLWSAIEHQKITVTVRDILRGQKPQPGAIGGTGNLAPISPVTPVSPVTPTGPGQDAFFTAVLFTLGAPPTPANLRSMNAWYAREEPSWPPFCTNNPLNTEIQFPGVTGICPTTSGVLEFKSVADGIAATAGSMEQIAPDVVSALRKGGGLCGQSFTGLYDWSGHSYSSVC